MVNASPKTWTQKQIEEIKKLLNIKTYEEIAKIFNCTPDQVRRPLRIIGYRIPNNFRSLKSKKYASNLPSTKGKTYQERYGDRWQEEIEKRRHRIYKPPATNWTSAHSLARKLKPKIGICSHCNQTKKTEIHHINRDWNDNKLENLEEICRGCHTREHRNNDAKKPSAFLV